MSNPLIESDGSKRWWLNGQRHREDGPACEYSSSKQWWLNGQRHREDGPAIETAYGTKEWWLNGQKFNEEEFALLQFMNGVNVNV